ncbi:MAG: UDP-N-acetylmuramate dehydrogenase [Bacteroidales bacterium]|jgi:UDP-N-acetylmuramate dehydrogenase|nr:UDP-N-acetylmuramate dehydrogenase [Bacteroidales bacterium]
MILKNVSLKEYNTFGLRYNTDYLFIPESEDEAAEFLAGGRKADYPLLVIGKGSNLLFTSDFNGTILIPGLRGIEIENSDSDLSIVGCAAGELWDDLVEWTSERGLGGLENLSLIPGTVGASAVQNIGAYGAEVKNYIIRVKALSLEDGTVKYFDNDECRFAYRSSIFKSYGKGLYLITKVWFRLSCNSIPDLSYGSLREEVSRIGGPTIQNTRKAVIAIRQAKLPDPARTGNAGSFFKNPVIPAWQAETLKQTYRTLPVYPDSPGYVKIAAAWLIEQCGWKGSRKGDAGVHDRQALVLVNYGNASGKDIYELSEEIRESVLGKFGVNLEREVELVGTI